MLSTALLMAAAPAKTTVTPDGQTKTAPMKPAEARAFVIAFVLFLIIDLALLVYTLYCLFECKLAWYFNVLILLLLFTPGLGFVTAISVIVYHYTSCKNDKKGKNAFEFEFF